MKISILAPGNIANKMAEAVRGLPEVERCGGDGPGGR